MIITSKNYENIVITDEDIVCSFGIPVVVVDGVAYGDADTVHESGEPGHVNYEYTNGAMIKSTIARREYADDQKTFDWIMKGVQFENVHHVEAIAQNTHADFASSREEGRKQSAWMFA
jgi:hypothetical protein